MTDFYGWQFGVTGSTPFFIFVDYFLPQSKLHDAFSQFIVVLFDQKPTERP